MECTLDVRIVCVVPEVILCQERILQFNASAVRERERERWIDTVHGEPRSKREGEIEREERRRWRGRREKGKPLLQCL